MNLRIVCVGAVLAAGAAWAGNDVDDAFQYLSNTRGMIGHYFDGEIINEMTKALERSDKALAGHESDPRYPLVAQVRADLASVKLKKKCTELSKPVETELNAGRPAPEEALAAYEQAVTAFTSAPPDDLKHLAELEAKKPAAFRARFASNAAEQAAHAKAEAEQKANYERAEADRKRRAHDLEVDRQAMLAGAQLSSSLRDTLEAPAEKVEAAKKAADELDALAPHRGDRLRAQVADAERTALWLQPDGKAQQAIADALQAKLIAKGSVSGKTFSTSFKADDDRCYLVITEPQRLTGSEETGELSFDAKAGFTALQPFKLDTTLGEQTMAGVCVTHATQVTAKTKLSFPGTKNGLRFAVLEWPRASFPAALAYRLELGPFDQCDAAQWKSLWTRPVPGTLVYRKGEPYLLGTPDGSLWDLTSAPDHAPVADLTQKAPARVAVKTQFLHDTHKPGEPYVIVADAQPPYTCKADEKSVGLQSSALFKCRQKVAAKYERAYADLDRMREQAARMGGIAPKAEAMRARLDDDAAKDEARTCGPLETKIVAAMERTYNELVDTYSDHPVQDSVDRLGH